MYGPKKAIDALFMLSPRACLPGAGGGVLGAGVAARPPVQGLLLHHGTGAKLSLSRLSLSLSLVSLASLFLSLSTSTHAHTLSRRASTLAALCGFDVGVGVGVDVCMRACVRVRA